MINSNVSDFIVDKNSFSSLNAYQHYQLFVLKQYPLYTSELKNYPKDNPVLIAIDQASSDYIRRLNGICLLCEKSYEQYELSFCYKREVWVLYSCQANHMDGINFACTIAKMGAIKIFVIFIRLKQ